MYVSFTGVNGESQIYDDDMQSDWRDEWIRANESFEKFFSLMKIYQDLNDTCFMCMMETIDCWLGSHLLISTTLRIQLGM